MRLRKTILSVEGHKVEVKLSKVVFIKECTSKRLSGLGTYCILQQEIVYFRELFLEDTKVTGIKRLVWAAKQTSFYQESSEGCFSKKLSISEKTILDNP